MQAKRVLVVDDEKNIRLRLTKALEPLQLDVQAAMNGEEALKTLEETDFGLILLDLRMPGMDGLEVLQRVRDARPDIRVIIITAHGTIESAVAAMKLGAVDFIQKPFAPKDIRELVQKVLDREAILAEDAKDYDMHIELAKRCIGDRKFGAAEEHVRQAIANDSTKPEALNLLGVLLEVRGDWLEAIKQYRAALALDPTYKPADKNLERVVMSNDKDLKISLGKEESAHEAGE